MKNVMYVFFFFATVVFFACSHNNSADITKKGKVADTIKGTPTFIDNQIHNNASSVSGAGSVITNPGDVKITNSKWNKNLSDTATIKEIMYHAAVSVSSQWGPSNTGVTYSLGEDPMTRSFKNYFKMSWSTMHYIRKSDYTSAQWDSMIQSELISGRRTYSHVWATCPAEPLGQSNKRY